MGVLVAFGEFYNEGKIAQLQYLFLCLQKFLHLMLNYEILLNALKRISFLSLFVLDQKHLAHLTLSQFTYNIEILEVQFQIGVAGRLESTTAQFPIFKRVCTLKLLFPTAFLLDAFKWNHEDGPCTFLDEGLI